MFAKAMSWRGESPVHSPDEEATRGRGVFVFITSALSSSSLPQPQLFAPWQAIAQRVIPERGQAPGTKAKSTQMVHLVNLIPV